MVISMEEVRMGRLILQAWSSLAFPASPSRILKEITLRPRLRRVKHGTASAYRSLSLMEILRKMLLFSTLPLPYSTRDSWMGTVRNTGNPYLQRLIYVAIASSQIFVNGFTFDNNQFNCFWQDSDGFHGVTDPEDFTISPATQIMGVFCTTIQENSDPSAAPPADTATDVPVDAVVVFQGVSVVQGVPVNDSYNATVPLTGQIIPQVRTIREMYSTFERTNPLCCRKPSADRIYNHSVRPNWLLLRYSTGPNGTNFS